MDPVRDVREARVGYDLSRPFGSFVEVVREVLLRPAAFFRGLGEPGPYGLRGPIVFTILCSFISSALIEVFLPFDPLAPEGVSTFSFFRDLFGGGIPTALFVVIFLALFVLILVPLGAILTLYIGAAFQHFFVWIFVRERKGFWGTFPVMAYGVSAALLFGWIPIVGLLAHILAIYITAIGLREMHETTTARATLAALGPGLLILATVGSAFVPLIAG